MTRNTLTHNTREVFTGVETDLTHAVTVTADAISDGLKNDLRAAVVSSGLGARLANTWRGARYPTNRDSLNAAAFVWSKAPDIIDAFDRGATIVPLNGKKYLAIPTENVPARGRSGGFGGRGSKMNPFEVETAFNQDLQFAKASNGTLIAFIEAVAAKTKRGFRAASFARIRQGRPVQTVVMFIMVPAAHMPKDFDIDAIADKWGARVEGLLADAMTE